MLLLAVVMFAIGIIHFVAPKWYHDFYPGFKYNQNDIFDREAVKTIGLWALTFSALAFYAAKNWVKSKALVLFLSVLCFAFILAQLNSFIHGYFSWPMAIAFFVSGIMFLISKLSKNT